MLSSESLAPMTRSAVIALAASLALAGCSGAGLSTGSIFGGSKTAAAAVEPAAPVNGDPNTRALQVGATSARALKCGYNFDPVKLKTSFLAYEMGQGADTAGLSRIEQIYDIAYNGVTKASATDPKYCSGEKTAEIKAALTRHLAGDYAPAARKRVEPQDDGGIFSGWGGGGGSASDKDVAIDQRTITGHE